MPENTKLMPTALPEAPSLPTAEPVTQALPSAPAVDRTATRTGSEPPSPKAYDPTITGMTGVYRQKGDPAPAPKTYDPSITGMTGAVYAPYHAGVTGGPAPVWHPDDWVDPSPTIDQLERGWQKAGVYGPLHPDNQPKGPMPADAEAIREERKRLAILDLYGWPVAGHELDEEMER